MTDVFFWGPSVSSNFPRFSPRRIRGGSLFFFSDDLFRPPSKAKTPANYGGKYGRVDAIRLQKFTIRWLKENKLKNVDWLGFLRFLFGVCAFG